MNQTWPYRSETWLERNLLAVLLVGEIIIASISFAPYAYIILKQNRIDTKQEDLLSDTCNRPDGNRMTICHDWFRLDNLH